jgi:3-oxoacyl-[acyl-carrier protein] reductase
VLSAIAEGGWDAEHIAAGFAPQVRENVQSVGESFPPLPAELDRSGA